MEKFNGFLRGYRALDLTDLKGQFCGRLLADLGMEVIKVEPPGGDPVRRLAPFKERGNGEALSFLFAHLNANKKSVVLDLEAAEDRQRFHRLVERADVVLESFSPGFLDAMALAYRDLARINPQIVMASITGFGQKGPRSRLSYTDIVAFAMSGLMYISGDPAFPPCKPPETQAYYFGSLFAALGVVAALYRRDRAGQGDHVEVSMQEALATQEHLIRLFANDEEILRRQGSQHGQVAPARIFPCRDGYVYLYVTRQHWKIFLEVWAEHPPEFDAPEWQNNLFRRARVETINQVVEAFTSKHTAEELTTLFQSRGIPCTPVNRPSDFTADEQVRYRGFVTAVEYPGVGTVKQPAAPYLVDNVRPRVEPAPGPGNWRENEFNREDTTTTMRSELSDGNKTGGAPLEGMRIVSFDHVLAGPYGTTVLAELGADVIKVESRRGGLDPFRFFGTGEDPNRSPRFLEFNRNKRSITVNLKHPDGPNIIKDLVRHSDAVLDNFSIDVMSKLGLAYEDLCQCRSDIIALRMPGLGCTGPKRHYSTVGTNITSFTGLTYLWNHPGNTNPPIGSQTVYPDYVSGVLSALLIVAGVLQRDRHKRGAFIDLAQAEATAFMIGANLTEAETLGRATEPMGNDSPFAAPHGCYRTKGEDQWCVIAVETDAQWRALAGVVAPELSADARFNALEGRIRHRNELNRLIERWTRELDAYGVMDALQSVDVPCGVVQNGADLVADPHLRERRFLVEVQNPRLGRVILPGFPLRFANCAIKPKWEFPELGRDTEEVLRGVIGYNEEHIAALVRDGVLE
ncbi:MAG: CoA transferase [Deltaproteobacteria bacterium]|nr:CoA transferase [Deltaproteobacteria bacterium]